MQDRLNLLPEIIIWCFFFITSVYGHIGFKLVSQTGVSGIWSILFNYWGITAAFSWAVSAILWIAILSKSPLFRANTVSAFSDVLIVLAAVFFFKENLTTTQLLGIMLVIAGIFMVTR